MFLDSKNKNYLANIIFILTFIFLLVLLIYSLSSDKAFIKFYTKLT
jgi:preprotein translocase subunit SecG